MTETRETSKRLPNPAKKQDSKEDTQGQTGGANRNLAGTDGQEQEVDVRKEEKRTREGYRNSG